MEFPNLWHCLKTSEADCLTVITIGSFIKCSCLLHWQLFFCLPLYLNWFCRDLDRCDLRCKIFAWAWRYYTILHADCIWCCADCIWCCVQALMVKGRQSHWCMYCRLLILVLSMCKVTVQSFFVEIFLLFILLQVWQLLNLKGALVFLTVREFIVS